MKPYESININAEKIASTIYSNIGEEMPSIFILIKMDGRVFWDKDRGFLF